MTKVKEIEQLDKVRVQAEMLIATISRWLAKQEVKAENEGRKWDPVALTNATTAHLVQHRSRLRSEAKLILSSQGDTL